MEYDPSKVSLEKLLSEFFRSSHPFSPSWSSQYASLLFYQGEEEKELMSEFIQNIEEREKRKVYTRLVPFKVFHLAEDYHQKYYLQRHPLFSELWERFSTFSEFLESPLVTKLNGYAAGFGEWQEGEALAQRAGLSQEFISLLRQSWQNATLCH